MLTRAQLAKRERDRRAEPFAASLAARLARLEALANLGNPQAAARLRRARELLETAAQRRAEAEGHP